MRNEFRSFTSLWVIVAWMWHEGKLPPDEVWNKWLPVGQEAILFARKNKLPWEKLRRALGIWAKFRTFNHDDYEKQVHQMWESAEEIYQARHLFENRVDLPQDHIKLLMDSLRFFRTENEGAFKRIAAGISKLGDPSVTGLFVDEKKVATLEKGNTKLQPKLQGIVRKLGGTGLELETKQAVAAKAKDPVKYAEYLALRRELNAEYKARLIAFFRSKKKSLIDVKEIAQHFSEKGWYYYVPKGFVGQMNENGRLFTTTGLEIDGLPQGNAAVIMNPKYIPEQDNAYVFKWYGAAGNSNQVYTFNYRKGKKTIKFAKVDKLSKDIVKIAKSWRSKLVPGKPSRDRTVAIILELGYLTQGRISSQKALGTFGLSTLQARHFKKKGNKYQISYQGKGKNGGVPQLHVVENTKAVPNFVKIIDEQLAGKAPNDPVFAWEGKLLSNRDVNSYIAKHGFTMHMFRHMRGTILAEQLLEKSPYTAGKGKAPNKAEVYKHFNEAMEKVGAILGHYNKKGEGGFKVTGTTAVKNYISPTVFQNYFNKVGVQAPPLVKKIIEKVLHGDSK